MTGDASVSRRRSNRWRLYAPFALLLVLAVLWSAAWLVIRDRTQRGLDEWIAAEAVAGRRWACADRGIAGYPFRIELTCEAFGLERPDLSASLGRLLVVSQIYAPRHVIAEATGPLRLAAGGVAVEATWRLLQVSLIGPPTTFERFSLSADGAAIRIAPAPGSTLPPGSDLSLTGEHLEFHLRPNPTRAAAFDASLRAAGTAVPGLGELIGGQEPADLDLDVTATEIRDARARPAAEEAEAWRVAGGALEITRLRLVKGPRRIEGTGRLGFDEAHRPKGQFDLAAAGLEGLLGALTTGRGGAAGALLGMLTGQPPARVDQGASAGTPGLKPLPPVRLSNGRLQIGPLTVPGLRFPAMY